MNKDDRPLDDAGLDYAPSEDLPPLPQPLPAADLGLDGAEGIATATNSNAADSNVPRFTYKTEKHGASLYITGVECARDQKSKAFGLQLGSGSACSVKQVLPYAHFVNAPQDVIRDGDVIISVNGREMTNYDQILQEIKSVEGDSLFVSIRRTFETPGETEKEEKEETLPRKRSHDSAINNIGNKKEEKEEILPRKRSNDSVINDIGNKKEEEEEILPRKRSRDSAVNDIGDKKSNKKAPSGKKPQATVNASSASKEDLLGYESRLRLQFIQLAPREGELIADLFLDDSNIGRIRAEFVRQSEDLVEKCERIGGDLEQMSDVLFKEGGTLGCSELQSYESEWRIPDVANTSKKKRRRPYFLYIHEFRVKEEVEMSKNERSDLISSALKIFLLDTNVKKWRIVAYKAGSLQQIEKEDATNDFFLRYDITPQLIAERWAIKEIERRKNIDTDTRPFLRLGFEELEKGTTDEIGSLYLTRKMLRVHSLDFCEGYKLRCEKSPNLQEYKESLLHTELQTAILREDVTMEMETHKARFATQFQRRGRSQYDDEGFVARTLPYIDDLISRGASVNKAFALHAVASCHYVGLLLPLIDRGGDINYRDKNFMTPLMVVAATVGTKAENDVVRSQLVVSRLIAHGAKVDLKDRAGRTALGYLYKSMKALNTMESSQLGLPETPTDSTLERLLWPTSGPTEADKRCRDI
jgi:hypothetical protein